MNLSQKVTILMISSVCAMLVAFASPANGVCDKLPGSNLSMEQMHNIIGACGPKCLAAGQVCGWGVSTIGGDFITDCCGWPECVANPAGVTWKCETTFTNRKLCQGSYKPAPDPPCNNSASSIDCGGGALCLAIEVYCQGCDCIISGVSLCGGIPYVTDCGQYNSCG